MPRTYRIAIVEGDDLIFQLVERWLGEAGHATRRVGLAELQRGNGVDLIIADVASPRAAGPLVKSLRAAHDAPLLLLSGRFRRGQGSSDRLAQQLGVKAVLPKPFTRDELITAIDGAMA